MFLLQLCHIRNLCDRNFKLDKGGGFILMHILLLYISFLHLKACLSVHVCNDATKYTKEQSYSIWVYQVFVIFYFEVRDWIFHMNLTVHRFLFCVLSQNRQSGSFVRINFGCNQSVCICFFHVWTKLLSHRLGFLYVCPFNHIYDGLIESVTIKISFSHHCVVFHSLLSSSHYEDLLNALIFWSLDIFLGCCFKKLFWIYINIFFRIFWSHSHDIWCVLRTSLHSSLEPHPTKFKWWNF